MAIPRDSDGLSLLESGTEFDCPICFQRSVAVLHEVSLWCESCGARLLGFDPTDHDRVQLDEEGRMSGRGPPSSRGRVSGTDIGLLPGASAASRRKWGRLRAINRNDRNGPTRSKRDAIDLISKFAATGTHRTLALELLDIGWPGRDMRRANQKASSKPMWRPAHPHGIGSSAAVSLHLSARMLNFDSKFTEWVERCLPLVENAASFGFRSLKRMKQILGEEEARKQTADATASSILARANLGDTTYAGLAPLIWEAWGLCTRHGSNLENHPRQVLAALCEIMAECEGLPVIPSLIESRFNVGRSYRGWVGKLQ